MAEQKDVVVSRAGEIPLYRVAAVMSMGLGFGAFISPMLAILISMGMDTVTITFWRTFLVGLTLLPTIILKKEVREELLHMRGSTLWVFGAYCITKTLGFLLYAEALRAGAQAFTVSTLSNTSPIFLVLFLFLFFREKTPWQAMIGIAICIVGVFYVGRENIAQLGGDMLSVVFGLSGAAVNSLNTLTGRSLRQKMSFNTLMGMGYLVSAAIAFFYAIYMGSGFSVPRQGILTLAFLSWGCTLIGHSSSTWAVKYVNPVTLSLINLCSPFLTAITAYFLLDQMPNSGMIGGAILVVTGLIIKTLADYRIRVRESLPLLDEPEDEEPAIPSDAIPTGETVPKL